MSRTESPATLDPVDHPVPPSSIGGLVEGMRLDQPTFHALYECAPPGVRAELINGVVYIPSPVGYSHGMLHANAILWIGVYAANTAGAQVLDNATAILGTRSEPQPDAMLRILPEYGGRSRNEEGYLVGAPELVIEVARSTRFIDLGPKLEVYERTGVQEYIVIAAEPNEVFWFGREGNSFVQRQPGDGGIYRSSVFPGLWLDPQAFIRQDGPRLLEVLELGLATPDHAAFVARLAAAKL